MARTRVSMVLLDDENTIVVYIDNGRAQEPKHTIVREVVGTTYWTMYDTTSKGSVFNCAGTLDVMYEKLRITYMP